MSQISNLKGLINGNFFHCAMNMQRKKESLAVASYSHYACMHLHSQGRLFSWFPSADEKRPKNLFKTKKIYRQIMSKVGEM